jgi:hypothetical protein
MSKLFFITYLTFLIILSISCKPSSKNEIAENTTQDQKENTTPPADFLDELKEEWKTVPNPIFAVYQGCEMGDYFHLIFEGDNEISYDFGNGKNELGEFNLYSNDFENNSDFIGKKFKITWSWIKSNFYCCYGEMNSVSAPVPSITLLELAD